MGLGNRQRKLVTAFSTHGLGRGNVIPRICICCGEPMAEGANKLSRNPNVCASCSSLLDGMDDDGPIEPRPVLKPGQEQPTASASPVSEVLSSHPNR